MNKISIHPRRTMSDHECKLCCVYESYLVISNFYLFLKMSMNTKQVNVNMTHLKHGLNHCTDCTILNH